MHYALHRLLVLPIMLVLAAVVFALLPAVGVVQAAEHLLLGRLLVGRGQDCPQVHARLARLAERQ